MRAAVLPLLLFCASSAVLPASDAGRSRQPERDRMVEEQLVARGINDARVLAAMRKVPRHLFVPDSVSGAAYADSPLPIGERQTISQPFIVAFMTEAARITPDDRVLEIGTGSGYQAAVAAELAREVYSIEIVAPLAERAAAALKAAGYSRVNLRTGDGYHGWPERAPFDVIIITAAPEAIPPALVAQLKEGGRMVVPVGPQDGVQNLLLLTKQNGEVRSRTLTPVRFVPFTRKKQ